MLLGEPSTPRSNNNEQQSVIGDDKLSHKLGVTNQHLKVASFGFRMLRTNLLRVLSLIPLIWLLNFIKIMQGKVGLKLEEVVKKNQKK